MGNFHPCAIGRIEIEQIVIAIFAGINLCVPAAHKPIFIEDDITGFTAKDRAIFRQAIDVLGHVADADLNEFKVTA